MCHPERGVHRTTSRRIPWVGGMPIDTSLTPKGSFDSPLRVVAQDDMQKSAKTSQKPPKRLDKEAVACYNFAILI